jgi:hypothetical protein
MNDITCFAEEIGTETWDPETSCGINKTIPFLFIFYARLSFIVIISKDYPIPSAADLGHKVEVADAFCEGLPIGKGLFLSHQASSGDILAKYPGTPEWHIPENEEALDFNTEYVFILGKFTVIGEMGRSVVERELLWNAYAYKDSYNLMEKAQFINTSHPRSLEKNYRKPNCVWGIKYTNSIELDARVTPGLDLYILSIKEMEIGTQLLIDYHWFLAWKGLWCLDRECDKCVEGLLQFTESL